MVAKKRQPAKKTTLVASSKETGSVTQNKSKKSELNKVTPIVGIGASAGGLEAFEHFFTNTPSDTGVAFVLIQHLDPTHKSILTDLIKRYTRMQVFQVEDGVEVQANCTYIIPPNRDMAILHNKLHLIEPKAPRGLRLPIDYFFRSLAQDRMERAICIILSGTGTDGTLGLKAIKGEGGMVMVQSPDTSKYDGMPRSAINTGMVDYILPAEKIPEQLLSFINQEFINEKKTSLTANISKPEEYLEKIYILIRDHTGHDFSFYKINTIIRRIERRMTVNQIQNISHYIRYLQQNPLEIDILFREFLIGVTNFFRDTEAFDSLTKKIIPSILAKQQTENPIRIWVTGCSTGEEAYSIAMLIQNQMDANKVNFPVQLFATDIDPEAIEIARTGIYPNSIAADVPAEYLKKYFIKEEDTYQVKKSIRDMLVFAVQSLIKDPPFSKLELVCCRNLLIYLQPVLQQRILSLFHYALNSDGYMFLGTSESIGDSVDYFSSLDKKWKIFQKKNNPLVLKNASFIEFPSAVTSSSVRNTKNKNKIIKESRLSYKSLTENLLLSQFSPGCIIINETGEMLFTHGRTGKYLENPEGLPSLNVLNQAREGMKIELATAMRKVLGQKTTVKYRNLKVRTDEHFQNINLTVTPIVDPPALRGLMAVVIEDMETPKNDTIEIVAAEGDQAQRVVELEQQLRSNKDYLRSTIEELETSNEELKSTNEELQSSNEELQSTNEELETSKEELQSVNEELTTVNSEHQNKIDDLTQANNDINNLMAATEIGILFLDMELHISRFTPAIIQFVNLIPSDIGRPINHIAANLKYHNLVKDIEQVLKTLITKEMEIQSEKDNWLLTRIMPYRTVDNLIQGVVITFVDITEQKLKLMALNKLQLAIEQSSQMVMITDIDGTIDYVNNMFTKMTGYTSKEAIVSKPTILNSGKQSKAFYKEMWDTIKAGENWQGELINKNKSGGLWDAYIRINPLKDSKGRVTHFVSTMENISERKRIEVELLASRKQLKKNAQMLEQQILERTAELTNSNQLLEEVFSSIHLQIIQLDTQFNFVQVNQSFSKARKQSKDYYTGRNYFELYPNKADEKLFQRVLETGEAHYIFAHDTDGSSNNPEKTMYWDWTLKPVNKKANKFTTLIITFINVTEREQSIRK